MTLGSTRPLSLQSTNRNNVVVPARADVGQLFFCGDSKFEFILSLKTCQKMRWMAIERLAVELNLSFIIYRVDHPGAIRLPFDGARDPKAGSHCELGNGFHIVSPANGNHSFMSVLRKAKRSDKLSIRRN